MTRFRPFLCLAVSSLAVMGLATAGIAQPDQRFVIVNWQAPKRCGSAQDFARRVQWEPVEGQGSEEAKGPRLQVDMVIATKGRRVVLQMRTAEGETEGLRELHSRSCEELLSSAAMILSLALTPALLFENESDRQVVLVDDVLSPVPALPRSVRQKGDDEKPLSYVLSTEQEEQLVVRRPLLPRKSRPSTLQMLMVTDVGTLPKPALGLAIETSKQGRGFRLGFRLTRWAEQTQYLDSGSGEKGGVFDFIEGMLLICPRRMSYAKKVGICLNGSLGRLSATGIAIDNPKVQVHPMANLGLSLLVELAQWQRWRLRLQSDAVVQLILPRYSAEVLEEGQLVEYEIHKPAAGSVRVALGLGVDF